MTHPRAAVSEALSLPKPMATQRWMSAVLLAALLALAVFPSLAAAQTQVPDRFVDQLVITGLTDPVGFAFLPDGRIILVERSGPVRLVAEGELGAIDPLLVVDSVDFSGDRGLTGVAIDPRWPDSPYVYVYYDALDGFCRITRYTASGDLTDPSSLFLMLDPNSRYDVINDIPDLLDLHNGGTVRFGPDSMMYAALGEDGFGCAAQDTTSLRGVVLRFDVRGLPPGPGGPADKDLMVPPDNPLVGHPQKNARLVWATGLRNPFRFHFDKATGDIFLGDVGFSLFEEVDVLSGPMPNFGWPYLEGPAPFVDVCPGIVTSPNLTPPIYAYDRTGFTASIIGGGVYRRPGCIGCGFPAEYEGDYFFSDFYEGFLRRLKNVGGVWAIAPPVDGQPNGQDWGLGFREVADYEQAHDGSLWYCRMSVNFDPGTGSLHRIYFDLPGTGVAARVRGIEFSAPYPSPSRGAVELSFTLPRRSRVEMRLFDTQGRVVRTLLEPETREQGRHRLVWDGTDGHGASLAPGIYHARLLVDGSPLSRRLIRIR